MVKAVFTHKAASIYDDLPEERYHFPRTYLGQVQKTVGDLIVYYEPRRTGLDDRSRTGRQAYFAVAQVVDLVPDQRAAEFFYAVVDPKTYVEFDQPVPFQTAGYYHERQLVRSDGETNKGAFGRAVRPLSELEFESILRAGFASEEELLKAQDARVQTPLTVHPGLAEEPEEFERKLITRVMSRPVRDAAFTRAVQRAYDARCAVTGLRIINGGGRAEVQAAHIRPVADAGPDSIRNGIALSGTIHWMFDRGLISIGPPPEFEIIVGRAGLPDDAMRLIRPQRRLGLPKSAHYWPAPKYLDYHRNVVFKG